MAMSCSAGLVFHRLTLASRKISAFPNLKNEFYSATSTDLPKGSDHEFQEKKWTSLVNLLERYGFRPTQFSRFLERDEFLLNSNLNEFEKSWDILLSLRLSKQSLVSLVCDCPGVLELEFLMKWKVIFSKVEELGISPSLLRKVLEISKSFQVEPDRCLESCTVLKDFGFSLSTVSIVLENFPSLIMMKESEILASIEFLLGIGIPKTDLERVFYLYPGLLQFDVEDRLKQIVEEFSKLGFSENEISKEIVKEPRVLSLELGEFSRCVELLRKLKCRVPIKEKIFSEGEFRAAFKVKLRVDCLCKHGLIRREAFKILYKEPRLILYEIDDIDKKIEFLVNSMNYDISCLVQVPEYLGVSFDKHIVSRFTVIDYLRSKGALDLELGLRDLIKPSRLRFYNQYVKPYPECQNMFGRFAGDTGVQKQHSVRLSELFKPRKYENSQEDVKNMKSFVESLP